MVFGTILFDHLENDASKIDEKMRDTWLNIDAQLCCLLWHSLESKLLILLDLNFLEFEPKPKLYIPMMSNVFVKRCQILSDYNNVGKLWPATWVKLKVSKMKLILLCLSQVTFLWC